MAPDHRLIKGALAAILVFGLFGTAVELLLLGHDEGFFQLIPLALIAIGLAVTAWHIAAGTSSSRRAMRATMLGFIAAGALGIVLHYRGNREFQTEVDPSIHGLPLFMKVMQSKAPPALAPGMMSHLGLLGLVCTYLFTERREKT